MKSHCFETWCERARGWLRVMQWDAWMSAVVYTFATVAFYLLGAGVLGRVGLNPEKGAMVRTLGFIILASKSVTQKSVAGISLKTLQLYAVVFTLRLSSILFFEGYLPFDASGDWFYQVNEVAGLLIVLFNIFDLSFSFFRSLVFFRLSVLRLFTLRLSICSLFCRCFFNRNILMMT